jgi:hypothetical protein
MMPHQTPDEFEKSLARQPLKSIPGAWRAEILAAAGGAQPAAQVVRGAAPGFLAALRAHLAGMLWPHPKAWAGLAVVWVFILALHLATRDGTAPGGVQSRGPSPEAMAELRQQHKLYAELMGSTVTAEVDRSRTPAPKPRSERLVVPRV